MTQVLKIDFGEMIKFLLSLYKPVKQKKSNANHTKNNLEELLEKQPQRRTKKNIKNIRNQLKQFDCFKINPNDKINELGHDVAQIVKRQNQVIIQLISPFAVASYYKKAQFLQITAQKRDCVRIILSGQVHIYQPSSHKSYKNCLIKVKDNQYIIDHLKPIVTTSHSFLTQTQQNTQQQSKQLEKNQQNILLSDGKLSISQTKRILKQCNILNQHTTPHHLTQVLTKKCLIAPINKPTFMMSKPQYQLTCICSTQCVIMEVDYNVMKTICQYLDNDQLKPYLKALLIKFEYLDYNKARQYVSKQNMIEKAFKKDQDEDQLNFINQKKRDIPQIFSCTYEIPYDGRIYFIVNGQVSLQITKNFQTKFSLHQCANSHYKHITKIILKLGNLQMFGFQEIGKIKEYNLKYIVSTQSKLLIMNENIVFNFKKQIQSIIENRNQLVKNIIDKMEQSLNHQQYKKIVKDSNNIYSPKFHQRGKLKIKQISYFGKKQFNQIHQQILFPDQSGEQKSNNKLTPQIIKRCGMGLQFSRNLMAISTKKINIEGGSISLRDKFGMIRSKKTLTIKEINGQDKSDQILRKIGVLNCQQITEHNLKCLQSKQTKEQIQKIQRDKGQFKRLRQKQLSLPKLPPRYSRKEDLIFKVYQSRRL